MSNRNNNPMLNNDEEEVLLPPKREENDGLENFFTDDEEVNLANNLTKEEQKKYGQPDDPIMGMIEERFKKLKAEYPTGGWKASQLISYNILSKMPENWLYRFQNHIEEGTKWTQRQLAATERSTEIADAQNNPTDDVYQDAAFRAVQALLQEFLDKKAYMGLDRFIMTNLVASEIIGLSVIDPIWRDRTVDEIIINGPHDVQVEIKGKMYRVPAAKFRDARHVLQMTERIFSSINKTLSKTTPYVDGRLHDQSRIAAVHTTAAPKGPNVAIRRHPEQFWTPKALVDGGSFDEEIGTWLGNMIYKGCSFLVLGGTSTGKTSFLNAMTGFYRDDVRIITIEENLEMKPNPKKMLAAAMEAVPASAEGVGGVTVRELVRGSLRMRPDGIIIGEVVDGVAYDLSQALNTGHFGASTVHANSETDGIYRLASLIQQGAELSQEQTFPLIAAAFDFVVYLEHFPEDGSRRLVSISELHPYAKGSDGKKELEVTQLFKFVSDGRELDEKGEMKIVGHWEKTAEISDATKQRRHLDLIEDKKWDELVELSSIPESFKKQEK